MTDNNIALYIVYLIIQNFKDEIEFCASCTNTVKLYFWLHINMLLKHAKVAIKHCKFRKRELSLLIAFLDYCFLS